MEGMAFLMFVYILPLNVFSGKVHHLESLTGKFNVIVRGNKTPHDSRLPDMEMFVFKNEVLRFYIYHANSEHIDPCCFITKD